MRHSPRFPKDAPRLRRPWGSEGNVSSLFPNVSYFFPNVALRRGNVPLPLPSVS